VPSDDRSLRQAGRGREHEQDDHDPHDRADEAVRVEAVLDLLRDLLVGILKASLMRRPYRADSRCMRMLAVLAVALSVVAPAAAATPRFALLDLHDLAQASRNEYGDVLPTTRRPHAAFVVRCGTGCRFGTGWLGFRQSVGPAGADVRRATTVLGKIGWSVRLTLSARGRSRWQAFARLALRRERRAGVPDVLAVAVGGRVVAAPFASEAQLTGSVLDLPGFSRSGARLAARAF
jgi:hypothetical protein